jgi:hypothetical protein
LDFIWHKNHWNPHPDGQGMSVFLQSVSPCRSCSFSDTALLFSSFLKLRESELRSAGCRRKTTFLATVWYENHLNRDPNDQATSVS